MAATLGKEPIHWKCADGRIEFRPDRRLVVGFAFLMFICFALIIFGGWIVLMPTSFSDNAASMTGIGAVIALFGIFLSVGLWFSWGNPARLDIDLHRRTYRVKRGVFPFLVTSRGILGDIKGIRIVTTSTRYEYNPTDRLILEWKSCLKPSVQLANSRSCADVSTTMRQVADDLSLSRSN